MIPLRMRNEVNLKLKANIYGEWSRVTTALQRKTFTADKENMQFKDLESLLCNLVALGLFEVSFWDAVTKRILPNTFNFLCENTDEEWGNVTHFLEGTCLWGCSEKHAWCQKVQLLSVCRTFMDKQPETSAVCDLGINSGCI